MIHFIKFTLPNLSKNKRDKNIIKILGAQIELGKELEKVYVDATNEPYGTL